MRRTILGCAAAAALAGCSDAATAPQPSPDRSDSQSPGGGTFTYVLGTTTYTQAFQSCGGETIDATLNEQSILTSYRSKDGATTVAFIGTYDQISGVGEKTNAKYAGSQVSADLSALSPNITVQATVTESMLKAKGQKNTYLSNVNYYVVGSDGSISLLGSFSYTGCTSAQAHAHDHDHDHDWDDKPQS